MPRPGARARPAAGRHLLVHRRSGLGDGDELRHHLAAGATAPRWSWTRPSSTSTAGIPSSSAKGAGLVHRAHRDPHDDARRAEAAARARLLALRFLASVGEPLNAECVVWGRGLRPALPRQLVAVRDRRHHDRQHAAMDIKPGAMGKPLPGIEAGIVERDGDGRARTARRRDRRTGAAARLAVDDARLSGRGGALRKCFAGGWYLTGDLAMRDGDGYFWFVGRADDLIKSSGHLIGPFEVESALIEHEAVAEAAVIGMPDETAGEVVKAFVTLKAGFAADEALERDSAAMPASGSAPPSPRARSSSATACRDPLGQDHAPAAARARTRPARGRSVHAGGGRAMTKAKPEARPRPCARPAARMIRIRRFEEKCYELYTQEKIRGFLHLYDGEEAVAVGVIGGAGAARPGRVDLPRARPCAGARHEHGIGAGRDVRQGHRLRRRARRLDASLRRRDQPLRRQRHRRRRAAAGGGAGLGDRMQGEDRVTACFFGDGALAEGEFHEAMNLAALWKLPVLFVLENNLYAMGTAVARVQANTDFAARAAPATACRPKRRRHGRGRGRGRRAPDRVARCARAGGRGSSNAAPTASGRIRCSTPRSTATRPRSSRMAQEGAHRPLPGLAAGQQPDPPGRDRRDRGRGRGAAAQRRRRLRTGRGSRSRT
jgi:hypothetical protein